MNDSSLSGPDTYKYVINDSNICLPKQQKSVYIN